METPHIPQYQTSFSHSHSDISENSANIPMAPISTPSTSTGFGSPSTLTITHNHKNQHTNDTPIIGEAPTQSNNNWGQSNPQEGKIQHEETPHIPQHRIGLSHLHPGISKSSANIPIAPISTPSTSTEFGSPSTLDHYTSTDKRKQIPYQVSHTWGGQITHILKFRVGFIKLEPTPKHSTGKSQQNN